MRIHRSPYKVAAAVSADVPHPFVVALTLCSVSSRPCHCHSYAHIRFAAGRGRRYGMVNHMVYDVFQKGMHGVKDATGLRARSRFGENLEGFNALGLEFRWVERVGFGSTCSSVRILSREHKYPQRKEPCGQYEGVQRCVQTLVGCSRLKPTYIAEFRASSSPCSRRNQYPRGCSSKPRRSHLYRTPFFV